MDTYEKFDQIPEIILKELINEQEVSQSSIYHIAVSPNGQNVAILNTVTLELKTCQVDNLDEFRTVKCESLKDFEPKSKICWSLAIANSIDIQLESGDIHRETLIALSCFDERDMMIFKDSSSSGDDKTELSDEEKGPRNFLRSFPITTWIISSWHEERIMTALDNIGGLVKFLDDISKDTNLINVLVINASGICKTVFNLDNIIMKKSNSMWEKLPFYRNSASLKEFLFPPRIQAELRKLYQNTSCLELLSRSIENDFFLFEDYQDRNQVIQMYNLKTCKLEMVFRLREQSDFTVFGCGNPVIAISRNKNLLAYCHGANSITLYLMENSLEVSTRIFPQIEKIISLDFINDDESLFIIAQDNKNSLPIIICWDLFSYMKNSTRILEDTNKIFSTNNIKLVRACDTMLVINQEGKIISIAKHPSLIDILKPQPKSEKPLIKLPLQYLKDSEWTQAVPHTTLQLTIGETTVQVWYKKENKSILKYIWTNCCNRKLTVKSLEIGHQEFKIELSYQSPNVYWDEMIVNLHWPYYVNTINDACSALHYLYERRDDPAGPTKQQQYEDLILQTEQIVFKFIKKNPSIWRLIEVRYNVMASLLRGRRINLIQYLLIDSLNYKNNQNNKFLHTPRMFEWPKKLKTSDLEIAIKCSEGKRQYRDAVVVGFLLNYYTDNAMENTGWMFTVSKSISLLFEHHLDSYITELFCKPIFGAKEIHIDESYLSPNDLPKGKSKYIRAFEPSTELLSKPEKSRMRKIKLLNPIFNIIDKSKISLSQTQHLAAFQKIQKVIPGLDHGDSSALVTMRMVPLPDFTVYPQEIKDQEVNLLGLPMRLLRLLIWPRSYIVKKESKLSPFLRVIKRDKNGITFDNPAIEAVIDFKWGAARNHFLRHAALYFTFAMLFGIITGAVKNTWFGQISQDNTDIGMKIIIFFLTSIFYYLGYYLLASEIIQMKHNGIKQYISVYNFFDLASVIMPICTYTSGLVIHSGNTTVAQEKEFTIAVAFTVLVMWMELFLLLRFFSGLIPNGSSFKIQNVNNNDELSDYQINQVFSVDQTSDNYFSNFAKSVQAVYFWINGRWDQLDQWTFWPIDLLAFVSSVLLITVMQNMLIAGVFDDAKDDGRHAVLLYRAELIAEYETLKKLFGDKKGNPRHIYYIGKSNKFADWLRKCQEYNKLCKASTSFSNINRNSSTIQSFKHSDPYDSDSDEDASDWNQKSQVSFQKCGNEINKSNRVNKMEIHSSYTSTSEDEFSLSPSLTIIENGELKDEISYLKTDLKSIENNLENKLILMEKKMTQMLELITKLSNN
ncbi:9879_t:CDS:2 [Diversispora eburnea]|uniref:9879_t:CDS:1 n=1 Tax=Diversispora eburnea TaxID=1213867 RepID=A0A9N9C0A8_9GLOM|nr:9879_t:CDS:2 [Diversispora eburnea]